MGRPKGKGKLGAGRNALNKAPVVLEFIKKYQAEHMQSPSYKEISEQVGIKSVAYVGLVIEKLCYQGYLYHEPGTHRRFKVTGKCPLCGMVNEAAADPLERPYVPAGRLPAGY